MFKHLEPHQMFYLGR